MNSFFFVLCRVGESDGGHLCIMEGVCISVGCLLCSVCWVGVGGGKSAGWFKGMAIVDGEVCGRGV